MGNSEEQELIQQAFSLMDFKWRRLGAIQGSGFQLKSKYDRFNAWISFAVEDKPGRESPVCISEEIMLGLKKPRDCPAFGKSCTREHPVGATMVSPEGTCTLYHKYRVREQESPQPAAPAHG
jgi:hydrogenase expression/formation protein HypD